MRRVTDPPETNKLFINFKFEFPTLNDDPVTAAAFVRC